jgi:polysaccharide biosynthesis/export protein
MASVLAVAMAVMCGGCAGSPAPVLPAGQAAYDVIPVIAEDPATAQLVRAGDRLAVRVYGEPELTSELYRVDAAGYLQMPLVGELIAAGQSPAELRAEIARRLGARYVRDPQVTVAVVESARSKFAVEGQVAQPGVYDAEGSGTLLSALAQAKSPTKTAKLDEILVFRMVNGQRMGARFDLAAIRSGRAADPQILAGDTIVVGFSAAKGAFRDFLESAPLIGIFTLF